jgi:transcriptional regulator with XRE-family HTH domain
MKKYESLGDLLIDYRAINKMSQIDLASLLDVDTRTISRWEKNQTLIKSEKEKELVEKLFIPYQVIRNLNTDNPLHIYYNPDLRTYSLSALMQKASAFWYKEALSIEQDRIHLLLKDTDVEFVADIQEMNKNLKPLKPELIKEAAKILPDLNLILRDQSGFNAGHISVLPLKYDAYIKIRDQEIKEDSLSLNDLTHNLNENLVIFYYYSLYSDSLENAYYLMNRLLGYFKERKFRNYIFAGITYRKNKIELLREMGLKIIWEETNEYDPNRQSVFLEGNFDMFLFGKMS